MSSNEQLSHKESTERAWPEHWLPREVARTSRVVLIGHQRYHQLTVGMDDAQSRGRLVGLGYRLINIHGDPQDPRLGRRGVYQRQIPEGEDYEEDGRPPACCPHCGFARLHVQRDACGQYQICARCSALLNEDTFGYRFRSGDVQ